MGTLTSRSERTANTQWEVSKPLQMEVVPILMLLCIGGAQIANLLKVTHSYAVNSISAGTLGSMPLRSFLLPSEVVYTAHRSEEKAALLLLLLNRARSRLMPPRHCSELSH